MALSDPNFKNNFNLQGIAGNFVDAEALIAFKDLFNKLGSANYDINQDGSVFNNDFRYNYLFNTSLSNLNKADICLLIATNPRLEAPILNVKIRKLFLNDVSIYNLGFFSSLNYYVRSLGNNADILVKILEGNHWFCQKLLMCQRPLILVGSSFYQRVDSLYKLLPYLYEFLHRTNSFKFDNVDFISINSLHSSGNLVTGLDLNIQPSYYTRSSNINYKNNLYYLLGADDISKPIKSSIDSSNNFIVYQGHHGDQSASSADVILPSITYFEKDSNFSSLFGNNTKLKAVFYSLGRARND